MPSFLPGFGIFAVAGLVAAAGPVIIHLLNRRRFRVIDWAAMDFLLEAVQRSRKVLHLRDLLLLLVRTACVLLFGFALARPFFASSSAEFDPDRPIHAVLIVDNSLSMGYQKLEKTILDEAKEKAIEFIENLPLGSRISIIPLCGTPSGYSLDAYRTKEDARDALAKIEIVDRSGTAIQAADRAIEACQQASELSKRVIFLGDQQRINWPGDALAPQWQNLPELQVVDVSTDDITNTWVSDFRVQDAIADLETQTNLVATIRHAGDKPRTGVQVTLSIDGVDVNTKTVDLEPGQILPVSFSYRFDVPAEPGRPTFVPAKVSIPQDELPQDDVRHLVVPVVAALPVVFVDQFGERENPQKNLYGETFHLRRLLAPITSRGDTTRQLVQIRHVTVEGLNREILQDARLVVMAGVVSPDASVPLLREYVLQGGQLVIAAGAAFDPAAWNAAAWLDGAGVLPAPLEAELVEAPPGKAVQLTFESLMHEYFVLPDVPKDELVDLYREPYFFKMVRSDAGENTTAALEKLDHERLVEQLKFLATSDARRKEWAELEARGKLEDKDRDSRDLDDQRRAELEPAWLLWDNQRVDDPASRHPTDEAEIEALAQELAERGRPRVLAALDNGAPWMIERTLGKGRVLFSASGAYNDWNNVYNTNAMLVYDRILRSLLESTLPQRNFGPVGQVTLPVRGGERRGRFEVKRPGSSSSETLFVEALGGDAFGVTVRDVLERGTYTVTAYRSESASDDDASGKLWEVPLAVNGPEDESDLAAIDQAALGERMKGVNFRWVGRDGAISLQGAQVYGQDLWWWLVLAVLLGLLAEFLIIAWPTLMQDRAANLPAGGAVATPFANVEERAA